MIKDIELTNFQSHKNSHLDFTPGLNVIVGGSDNGKSSIIRAIKWIVFNRPFGDSFRSDWGGNTRIKINTDEGRQVKRIKTDSRNEYSLDGTRLSAGTSVPDDVSKVLNINEINIGPQFDRNFLIMDSPGEVARHFNRVAHLDQIDKGTKNISRWTTDIKKRISYEQEKKESILTSLEEYADLDQIEYKVEEAEEIENKLYIEENKIDDLIEIIEKSKELEKEIEEQNEVLKAEKKVKQAEKILSEQEKIDSKIMELDNYIIQFDEIQEIIDDNNKIIKAQEKVDELENYQQEIKKSSDYISSLKQLIRTHQRLIQAVKNSQDELDELKNEFHERTGDICPLCGQNIEKVKF